VGGAGRGLIWGTIPVFAWKDWEKSRKASVSIVGVCAEVRTRDLPDTKQKYYPLDDNFGYK
jgi:hypothetical protein